MIVCVTGQVPLKIGPVITCVNVQWNAYIMPWRLDIGERESGREETEENKVIVVYKVLRYRKGQSTTHLLTSNIHNLQPIYNSRRVKNSIERYCFILAKTERCIGPRLKAKMR